MANVTDQYHVLDRWWNSKVNDHTDEIYIREKNLRMSWLVCKWWSFICGGGQGGLDPLPPGSNPYPRPFFSSLPPPHFLLSFFGCPRPKFRFFAPALLNPAPPISPQLVSVWLCDVTTFYCVPPDSGRGNWVLTRIDCILAETEWVMWGNSSCHIGYITDDVDNMTVHNPMSNTRRTRPYLSGFTSKKLHMAWNQL